MTVIEALRRSTARRVEASVGGRYWFGLSSGWWVHVHVSVQPHGILCVGTGRLTDYTYDGRCIHCIPPRARDFRARELRRWAMEHGRTS